MLRVLSPGEWTSDRDGGTVSSTTSIVNDRVTTPPRGSLTRTSKGCEPTSAFAGDQVTLRKADGVEVKLKLDQLSDPDQKWIREQGR